MSEEQVINHRTSLASYPQRFSVEASQLETDFEPSRPSRVQGMMNMGEEENSDEFISDEEEELDGEKNLLTKRPKDTPFIQQRIKSYNPIFTTKLTVSIFFVVCAIFILFGGILIAISNKTNEVIIHYQECSSSAPTDSFGDIPEHYVESYFHQLKSPSSNVLKAQWRYTADADATSDGNSYSENGTCTLRFTTPYVIKKPIYMSYLIKDYYPNHRRYALSFNEDQLEGKETSINDIHTSTGIKCAELYKDEATGKQIYPCGLIANSMFNDTFSSTLTNVNNEEENFVFTTTGITWGDNSDRFKKTKLDYSKIAPPPYWKQMFPDGYNSTNVPDISSWEHFQNWMSNPALPIFSKLMGKNLDSSLVAGLYQIDIGLNWPVKEFHGQKALYLSHGSSIGGRNNFLGEVYLVGGLICLGAVAIVVTGRLLSGRRNGDRGRLSWNQ
ncbi:hypothetical protein QEN19_004005 [Hanseniaspora menglaensis]